MDAGAQHRIGDLHRIEEARTHRRDVEGDAIVDAEHRLHLGRGRREGLVGGRGGEDDQVDILRGDARRFERGAAGLSLIHI